MDSEKTTLEHVELNEADLSDEIIQEFDCGNDDMNEYLYDYARDDSVYGRGVTYVLWLQMTENVFMLMQH